MIKGFERETQPLTDYEINFLVPQFERSMKKHVGKANAVTNKQIVQGMLNAGYKINDAKVRKIFNWIRTNDIVYGIIATSDGYYIAETKEEIAEYIESLEGRRDAIDHVITAMRRQLMSA